MDGTLFGRYQLVELMGRGGMGEVWRAYDPDMERVVALKVLPKTYASDKVFRERFRREAQAAAGLDEPHVVPIHEFGEVDGRLYVTMRLIKGRDLDTLLEDGPLEPRERWASSSRLLWRWTRRTGSAWSTATSNRPTSWLPRTTSLTSSTSVSHAPPNTLG